MDELASKLMGLGNSGESQQTRETLGTVNDLTSSIAGARASIFPFVGVSIDPIALKRRFRAGMWPCVSHDAPETAMGLMAVLAALLERWQDIVVYRLFTRLEGLPDEYQWTIARSQFGVDDWQLDDLDENVALWGNLEHNADGWSLQIEVENDLDEAEEPTSFVYRAAGLSDLMARLPQAASEIAAQLDASASESFAPAYSISEIDGDKLQAFLKRLFHWERQLLLHLWGKAWLEETFGDDHRHLLAEAQALECDFGAWCAAVASARAMLPQYTPLGELLVSSVIAIAASFPDTPVPAICLAMGLFGLDYHEEALDLLETHVEEHPENTLSWLALAELYRRTEKLNDAADTFQRAIEEDAEDARLLMRYADLLLTLDDYYGLALEHYVFVDPDKHREKLLVREAIEVYDAVLELEPDHTEALYNLLAHLADIDPRDARLWPGFEHLVKLDESGNLVRGLVESLYSLSNVEPAAVILRREVGNMPGRYDLHVNLAVSLLMDEQEEEAESELKKGRVLTNDPDALADIDRLMLSATDPEFEGRLGEITDLIGAGASLDVEDVDFLEAAIEQVPTFADGYLLLAEAYLRWGEDGACLEILLDGHKSLPDHPEIVELLARVLWNSGEQSLALEYMGKALVKNPTEVPLLAQMGQYLFEDGQVDRARAFLARAELFGPRHPALHRARVIIARHLSELAKDEDDFQG